MKKTYRMTVESRAVPLFRAAVYANPGQAARDLSASLGYKYAHGVAVLTLLRKAGDIMPVRAMGGMTEWWPTEMAAERVVRWRAMRRDHDKRRKAANRKANPTNRLGRIAIDSPAAVKVLEAIAAHPGIQSTQMATLTGCKLSHVKNVLSVIRNAGKAQPIPGSGRARHWYTQDAADPYLEAWEAKRRKRTDKPPTKRDRIAELSQHPDGVRMSAIMDLLSIGQNIANRHVSRMVGQGRLHRADRAGARLRWFDTAQRAAEWAAMPAMEPSEWSEPRRKAWAEVERKPKPIKAPKLVAIGERLKNSTRQPSKAPPLLKGSDRNAVIRQKPGIDAGVTLHGKPSDMRGEVDYSRAKITICPAPQATARWQCAPGSEAYARLQQQWQDFRGAA